MELVEAEVIPVDKCWELLSSAVVGRLALSVAALPAILPVQYHVVGDELAICLGHHTIADRSVNDAIVAFAADSIPTDTTGWSVQVQGTARTQRAEHDSAGCGQPTAGQIIRLKPVNLTGHLVRLCPLASSGVS